MTVDVPPICVQSGNEVGSVQVPIPLVIMTNSKKNLKKTVKYFKRKNTLLVIKRKDQNTTRETLIRL